jgi:hypothetical protein
MWWNNLAADIIALSGGKDSCAMALRLRELEPERDYTYICTPTGNELPVMVEHWLDLGRRLGKPIIPVSSGRSLGGLIRMQNALPNWRMRWCTRMLKIEPFERYVLEHRPCTVYVGIRADEVTEREGVDYGALGGDVVRRFPLAEWGWGINQVMAYLSSIGVCIPDRTDCAACFFQTLWEWYSLWLAHPATFAEAEGWEAATGHTLRSEQRDTWPAALSGLRKCFEIGMIPKQRQTMKDRKAMCAVCAR